MDSRLELDAASLANLVRRAGVTDVTLGEDTLSLTSGGARVEIASPRVAARVSINGMPVELRGLSLSPTAAVITFGIGG